MISFYFTKILMNVRKQVVSVSKPAQILGARINAAAKLVTL